MLHQGEPFGEEAILKIMRPVADNAGALAWLESALEHARDRGQKGSKTS